MSVEIAIDRVRHDKKSSWKELGEDLKMKSWREIIEDKKSKIIYKVPLGDK